MDINKADYGTIIKFGNLKLFLEKLKIEGNCIEEIVDSIDKNGISLLEKSLISRKFDIANFLLDNGAKVNIISNDDCNEFHYLAANINCQGAVEVACRLVDMGVDLNLKDKKFGNSAIWSLCQEVLKKRTKEGNDLIVKCLGKRPNINDENKYGYSLRDLIEERGTDNMKKVLEMIV
ncbi:ankyrin repeat domain-containing protein [Bacillus paranthracis]|uniref:ankyrin repeat domain-containing protein n=1 Tax=Bacillus cereus group TaxID=86661 RepID=UPI0022E540E1|nr:MULTISPECIES: ankyrin repeat domain-containing protein [Bacillus cereus group]MDA1892161.1 ankyrin repeat domain-containing protein [Bacillus cereus group sp. BY11-1LC]MDA2592238.1 ankyrin repeat domain-containing protein [Bacillus cereus group sp. Bc065]MDK7441144.1 ankyrin repeat domain-containing protein [Bacillus paranthracis]MDK7457342.1 ankyrin repeat domain-containing protein [Bacillus paranthracis]